MRRKWGGNEEEKVGEIGGEWGIEEIGRKNRKKRDKWGKNRDKSRKTDLKGRKKGENGGGKGGIRGEKRGR